jgi:very-short-patch-repair endonuclease
MAPTPAQIALHQHAQRMRSWQTPSEARLWEAIRGKKLGVHFRRQVVIGRCIVDFLAPAVRLVVEVDGEYHQRRLKADARRDETLRRLGYRVLRLDSALVLNELAVAVERVRVAVGR